MCMAHDENPSKLTAKLDERANLKLGQQFKYLNEINFCLMAKVGQYQQFMDH